MVDAQAPGLAAALRGLAAVTGGAPARLLSEYALLHLLIRAHERLDELPADLAAVVRSRVGYPVSRDEVFARPAVTDDWAVLAVRELTDAKVPGRRIWLHGRTTGRPAMLLTYAAPNGAWQDPGIARLRPGDGLRADLHFFPGQPELRALLGARDGEPAPAAPPAPVKGIGGMLRGWSAALEHDPWLTAWPAFLTGTPVPPEGKAGKTALWHLVDGDGAALPLADPDSLWTLLAVSGGHPVTVAGEWQPDGLVALTTWHGNEAVAL
jgi:hypothetical protein